MDRILSAILLSVLFCSCRQATESPQEAIVLSCSVGGVSKTDALTAGDEVAVFGQVEGTETYFMEAAKFTTGADGKTLAVTPAVYYPETKQAVNFFAYFPYHTSVFSVPSDQSTPEALKKADLCWATTSTTPVPTAVSLQFNHLLARLIVQTNTPTEKIACLVVPGGTLNPATGLFTLNSTQSEVSSTGNELIVPAQPLTRLVMTVAGVDYVFEHPFTLQGGQTTVLNLTLHPSTKTATLSGISTTDWIASTQTDQPAQLVSNTLTLHCPNYFPPANTPDKVVLTIGGVDYSVDHGVTYADKSFTFAFAAAALRYPYQISKITFYYGSTLAFPTCANLLGAMIYRSGSLTVGINDPLNTIKIGNLWWATGNLVASDTQGAAGKGGCTIGAPADYGLYFQFGSLVGWTAGAKGNGAGVGSPALDKWIWPTEMGATKPSFGWQYNVEIGLGTLNHYFFNYTLAPWNVSSETSDIGTFAVSVSGQGSTSGNLRGGRYARLGVGDPCTYYLGEPWRMATMQEYRQLTAAGQGAFVNNGGVYGRWFGKNPGTSTTSIFFPAAGHRLYTTGALNAVGTYGGYRSCSIDAPPQGHALDFDNNGVYPKWHTYGCHGFSARCVRVAS